MKNVWMSSDWLRVTFLLSEISRSIGLFDFNILGQCKNILTMDNEDVDLIVFQTICKSVFFLWINVAFLI